MLLHLIRHGQTNWNQERRVQGQSESRLTELGIKQATELQSRLAALKFDRIYCSSSTRTRETADCLFPGMQNHIRYMDEFREIHLGPWEGQLYDEVAQHSPLDFEHFWNTPDLFNVTGAETFLEMQQRGLKAIKDIACEKDLENVVIVSHGAFIKSVLCHYEERHLKRLWEPPQMHNCAHNILELDVNGNGFIVRYADINWPKGINKGRPFQTFSV